MKQATSIARPNLSYLGTCLGKFSKTRKFRLHVTALEWLAKYAKHKVGAHLAGPDTYADIGSLPSLQVWIKPNGEMPFLYGNHVVKAHLGRITEDTPEHQGVVIFSMSDIPLGFGVTAKSSVDSRKLDPTGILVYNQA
jgi:60S ribosome subunit biogenesis protein NIP7